MAYVTTGERGGLIVAYLTMGERGVIRVPGPVTVESFSLLPFEARLVSGELADGGSAVPKIAVGFCRVEFREPLFSMFDDTSREAAGGGGIHDVRGVGSWVIHIFVAIICMAGRERRGVGMCMIGRE